jgi:hypothetical protein
MLQQSVLVLLALVACSGVVFGVPGEKKHISSTPNQLPLPAWRRHLLHWGGPFYNSCYG